MNRPSAIYLDEHVSVYTVFDDGKIYNRSTKKYLTPTLNKTTGYLAVSLKSYSGKVYYKLIHRLVAEAFIPNPLNKRTVNHIDGNKCNNHYMNLEWATDYENVNDAWIRGCCTPRHGEYCNFSKHTNEQVHQVCKLLEEMETIKNIANITGVSKHVIRDILFYGGWKTISSQYDIKRDIYRQHAACEFDIITNERIKMLYETNPNITPKIICKKLDIIYNNDSRRAIYKIKNISKSSTTIERDKDKYYIIDINL